MSGIVHVADPSRGRAVAAGRQNIPVIRENGVKDHRLVGCICAGQRRPEGFEPQPSDP
jgi:hypothetical protein